MATANRHSLHSQPKRREEKKALLCNDQFQNRRQKQLTKVRTRKGYALDEHVSIHVRIY